MTPQQKNEAVKVAGCAGALVGLVVLLLAWIVVQLLFPNACVRPAAPVVVSEANVLGPSGIPPGRENIYDKPRALDSMRRASEGDVKTGAHLWQAEKGEKEAAYIGVVASPVSSKDAQGEYAMFVLRGQSQEVRKPWTDSGASYEWWVDR